MYSNSSQSLGHPLHVIQSTKVRGKSSLLASVLLGVVFNATLISVMGTDLGFFESTIGNTIAGGAMASLIVFSLFRSKKFTFTSLPNSMKMSLTLLVLTTIVLGSFGYVSPDVPNDLRRTVLIKTIGLLLTIVALVFSVRVFSLREITNGLILFSVLEMIGCSMLFVSEAEVNRNAVSVRAAVAGMTLYALLPRAFLGFSALLGCMLLSVLLGCRTSIVATLGAVTFLFVERRSRKNRVLILIVTVVATVLALVFMPAILSGMREFALNSLGSNNVITQYFLHDKSSSKIRYDYLDRFEVWDYSWSFVRERPWLGHGLGTEHEIMGVRSHCSYLSVMFDGGALYLAVWLLFYLQCLYKLFDKKWLKTVGDTRIYFLTLMLLGYMLLAGIVESSGIASIATPINLIFIFLVIWLFQPRPESE